MSCYSYKKAPVVRAAAPPNEDAEASLAHEHCPEGHGVFDPVWHARMYARYGERYYDLYSLGVQHELCALHRVVR